MIIDWANRNKEFMMVVYVRSLSITIRCARYRNYREIQIYVGISATTAVESATNCSVTNRKWAQGGMYDNSASVHPHLSPHMSTCEGFFLYKYDKFLSQIDYCFNPGIDAT